jgi:sensor histidine kinase regulating citrate/malate metabolism
MNLYETNFQTGNEILDILLSVKSLKCLNNDITLTVVADGSILSFINPMDLSSIIGNALDNAIENVISIEKSEKRLIKLAIFKEKEYASIRIENYYEHQLELHKGNFFTTKKDKSLHGFGIMSIKSIAAKYNGYVTINTENQWFKLFIILPQKNVL